MDATGDAVIQLNQALALPHLSNNQRLIIQSKIKSLKQNTTTIAKPAHRHPM